MRLRYYLKFTQRTTKCRLQESISQIGFLGYRNKLQK
jgi:hypothetical protein